MEEETGVVLREVSSSVNGGRRMELGETESNVAVAGTALALLLELRSGTRRGPADGREDRSGFEGGQLVSERRKTNKVGGGREQGSSGREFARRL